MEPPIRYARTSDGLGITYWTMGEGAPLIHMPWMPWSDEPVRLHTVDWR